MISFLLIFFGYTISIFNAVNVSEAALFTLQFWFIISIQLPVLCTLTKKIHHFRNHCIALFLSLIVIILYFYTYLIMGFTTIPDSTSIFYNNPNTFATMTFLVLIPSTFLLFDLLTRRRYIHRKPLFSVFLSLILLLGLFAAFSSQSRRIFIGLLVFLPMVYFTPFLQKLSLRLVLRRIFYGVILIIPFGAVITSVDLFSDSIFWRIQGTLTGTHEGSGLDRRMWYNEVGMKVSIDQFPFGTGYNNYGYFSQNYVGSSEIELLSEPHNLIIEPFAEGGVIAGIGIMLLFGIIFSRAARIALSNKQIELLPGAFVVATASFFAIHMVGTLIIFRMYWLVILLAVVYVSNHNRF